MSIERIKSIDIESVIISETGLKFARKRLEYCPFCNSGNHGGRTSDSGFHIKKPDNYFKCFVCGAKGTVIDFIMKYRNVDLKQALDYLENKYIGRIASNNKEQVKTEVVPDYIPPEWVSKSVQSTLPNHFTTWLKNQFGEKAVEAIQLYCVGSAKKWNGATVFYNIDEVNKVRRGKIILYDPTTGKRSRDLYPSTVHYEMKLANKPEPCLFGMHLKDQFPDKEIAVVESEKTAIIMSIVCPEFLWMATGGLTFLNAHYFSPLQSRKVILLPDLGEDKTLGTPYEQWERKLPEIGKYIKDVRISDLLERKGTIDQRMKGYDIADYFVREMKTVN